MCDHVAGVIIQLSAGVHVGLLPSQVMSGAQDSSWWASWAWGCGLGEQGWVLPGLWAGLLLLCGVVSSRLSVHSGAADGRE